MAYKQGKNPFSKNPLNFNSPLNSFDSLVGKLMNQGKSKEAATKIAGKVANMKMKGAGSGPTAAQKARAKGSPAKEAKPDFLDLDKDGNTTESMKDAAKGSAAKMKSPIDKELVGDQKNLNEGLKKAIQAAPESPAKMKSPVKAHEKELKALEKRIKRVRQSKEGSEGQGGIDYELLADLEAQKKRLIESHGKQAKDAKAKPSPASKKFDRKAEDIKKRQEERLRKEAAEKKAKKKSPAKMESPATSTHVSPAMTEYRKKNVRKKKVGTKEGLAKRKAIIKKVRKAGEAKVSASAAKMKSPMKKDGKKGDLLSKGAEFVKKNKGKIASVLTGGASEVAKQAIKKVAPKVKKGIKAVKKFAKEQQKVAT